MSINFKEKFMSPYFCHWRMDWKHKGLYCWSMIRVCFFWIKWSVYAMSMIVYPFKKHEANIGWLKVCVNQNQLHLILTLRTKWLNFLESWCKRKEMGQLSWFRLGWFLRILGLWHWRIHMTNLLHPISMHLVKMKVANLVLNHGGLLCGWDDYVSCIKFKSDIAYTVHSCARFTHYPKRLNEKALKWIAR